MRKLNKIGTWNDVTIFKGTPSILDDALLAFSEVIRRTVIHVYKSETEYFERGLLERIFSRGMLVLPGKVDGEPVGDISCEDVEAYEDIDGNTDIKWSMFYCSRNVHPEANKWDAEDSVVIVDGVFHGAWLKQIVVDGQAYGDAFRGDFWIHYNMRTGQVWLG